MGLEGGLHLIEHPARLPRQWQSPGTAAPHLASQKRKLNVRMQVLYLWVQVLNGT